MAAFDSVIEILCRHDIAPISFAATKLIGRTDGAQFKLTSRGGLTNGFMVAFMQGKGLEIPKRPDSFGYDRHHRDEGDDGY